MMPLLSQRHQFASTTSSSSATSSSSPASVADRIAGSRSYHYHPTTKAHDHQAATPVASTGGNSNNNFKSQSIPISKGMHRTASEVQLCEDEAMADYRDFVVFSRIVNGISRQQEQRHSMYLRQENDRCLAHIMSTRNSNSNSNDTLQSFSQHIVRGAAPQADDYFCGDEPYYNSNSYPSFTTTMTTDNLVHEVLATEQQEEEGIFTLEL